MFGYALIRAITGAASQGAAAEAPGCSARRLEPWARILAEFDALPEGSPERGALMRRERLYHSHLEHWRSQQEKGTLPARSGKRVAIHGEHSLGQRRRLAILAPARSHARFGGA